MNASRHVARAGNATAAYFGFWSRHGLLGLMIGIALLGLALYALASVIAAAAGALLALIVGLIVARFRWPKVRFRHYFTSWRATLSAMLAAFGLAGQYVLDDMFASPSSMFSALAWGTAATASLSVLIAIFEEKIMAPIFQLVPFDEQAALAQQLDDLDKVNKGREGQAADFSTLDQGNVSAAIERRVIGQNPIVEQTVAAAFRRSKLNAADKPVGVFLFVGASGSGKTELAKALAVELFAGRLIRVDCNELSESHNVQRLIGSPPGYEGSDQGGQLCRDLARTGTGVLLLDEIEKAHPAALKVLMNLLDEARLTEQSTGRTYSARGFLIVLTSNAAADAIAKIAAVEPDPVLRETKTRDALTDDGFLPEIVARIDTVFPFARLSSRDVARIIERFLMKFSRDVGIELESADSALLLDLVTRANKTRDYGIREVVRSVENAVVDGLTTVKDAGFARALIRVIDGKVSVQPAASDAADARRA